MTQLQPVPQGQTIASILMSDTFKNQLAMALPKHMDAKKVARTALTEVRKNPKLLNCTSASFMASMFTASQLGLEVGSAFGQAYLVPYKEDCQLIVGYRGMVQLAHRSGQIKNIHADIVYKNDFFDYQNGIEMVFKHVPNNHVEKKEEDITHVYAYAHLVTGGFEYVVLDKKDIDRIKETSNKKQKVYEPNKKTIWDEHYEEMAKKTALRRLFKMLPVSSEIIHAVSIEDARETGDMSLLSDFGGDDFTSEETKTDALIEQIGGSK